MRQIELHQPCNETCCVYLCFYSEPEGGMRIRNNSCDPLSDPRELWISFCLLLRVLLSTVTLNIGISFCFMISTFSWCSEQTLGQPAGAPHLAPRSTSPAHRKQSSQVCAAPFIRVAIHTDKSGKKQLLSSLHH